MEKSKVRNHFGRNNEEKSTERCPAILFESTYARSDRRGKKWIKNTLKTSCIYMCYQRHLIFLSKKANDSDIQ